MRRSFDMPKKIDPDATRSDKLLTMYRLLLTTNRKYSTTELTELLNCSKQSVRYIVDALNFHPDIEIQEETDPSTRAKRYFIEHGSHGLNEPIDIEGYRQMELCRDIIGDLLPDEDKQKLDLALLNASNYLVRKERVNFKTVSFACGLTKGYIDYNKLKDQLHDIYTCINDKKCCNITYQHFINGETKDFCIAPIRIVVLHESFYLEGYIVKESEGEVCFRFDNPTNFSVQRIIKTDIQHDRSFAEIKVKKQENNKLFGLIREGEPFKVRLKFTTPYAVTYVSDRVFSQDQQTKINEDGSLELSFMSDSTYEVRSFVLGFGASVTVLEPEALREDIKKEIKKLEDMYK